MDGEEIVGLLQLASTAVGALVLFMLALVLLLALIAWAVEGFGGFVWDVAYERRARVIARAKREAEQIVAQARKEAAPLSTKENERGR